MIFDIPTSETRSEGEYMSLMSCTEKSEFILNLWTGLPFGVTTMFFLTRYMSISGAMRRW